MYCSKCGTLNKSEAKFCVSCGSPLKPSTEETVQTDVVEEEKVVVHPNQPVYQEPVQPQPPYQPQTTYDPSENKMFANYWDYFKTILKRPMPVVEKITKNEYVFGLITIFIFALLIPLMIYFAVRREMGDFMYRSVSFTDFVIEPLFYILLVIFLVIAIIFGVLNIGKSSVGFQEIMSKFGALLVAPTVLLAVAFVFSLFDSELLGIFLYLGLIGFSFSIPLIIYSYRKNATSGPDAFYATLLTYIGFFIALVIIGEAFNPEFYRFL